MWICSPVVKIERADKPTPVTSSICKVRIELFLSIELWGLTACNMSLWGSISLRFLAEWLKKIVTISFAKLVKIAYNRGIFRISRKVLWTGCYYLWCVLSQLLQVVPGMVPCQLWTILPAKVAVFRSGYVARFMPFSLESHITLPPHFSTTTSNIHMLKVGHHSLS